jgi:hypothetical protein
MKESVAVWQYLERHTPRYIAIERMEVMYPPGLADTFFTDKRSRISGWLELKHCKPDDKEFRAGRLPKLKPEQPMFLRRQTENGCPCGIILRVGESDWYFWRARSNREWVEAIRGRGAIGMADVSWSGSFDPAEMFEALDCPVPTP